MKYLVTIICSLITGVFSNATEPVTIYTEEFPPYQKINEKGDLTGFSTEKVKQIFDEAGIEYKFSVVPWARALNNTQNIPNTFVFSILKTKERADQYLWLAPLCNLEISISRIKHRTDINVKNIKDATKYIVGVVRGQPKNAYLIKNGFELNKNLIVTNSTDQLVKMMLKNRIDLIISSHHYIENLKNSGDNDLNLLEHLFTIKELGKELYLASNKDTNVEMLQKLKTAYEKQKQQLSQLCFQTSNN